MVSMRIDNEFKALIPPLKDEEWEGLERSILEDGIRDPLVLWGDILVDGHNRYEIAQLHDVPFSTVQKEFDSRDDAKLWIYRNQLSRRNLNDFQRIEITHKCEDAVRAKAAERQSPGVNQYTDRSVEILPPTSKARDELGSMAGVSGKTYEHAVTVLESAPEQVTEATRSGDLSINAAYQVTRMEQDEQDEIAQRIESGESPREVVREVKNRPHVANNSGNNEWYTPSEYIEAAREVMGTIDTDPASSEVANQTVKASTYYTAETNGLEHDWTGNVWMNPPYASDLIGKFADKLLEQRTSYAQAIVLVNNATETEWFAKIASISSAVCFPRGRVKFYSPDGKIGAPLQGQAIAYIGDDTDSFVDGFSQFGWVARIAV